MARPTNPRSTIIICRDGARRDTAKLLVDPSAPSRSPCATIATTSRPSGSLGSARAARPAAIEADGIRYFSQFIFAHEEHPRAPGEPSAAGSGAWLYRFREKGYEFFARLPLYLAADFAREDVDRLALLVDVIDVDDTTSTKQKTVVSSSATRLFGDPSTFETVTLAEPYRVPLSACERATAKLYDDGFWRRIEGRYERVRWGSEVWSGCAGVDRDVFPGYWERLPAPVAFPPDFTMRLSSNGADGMLSEGDRCTLVKLVDEGTPQAGSEWTPRFRTVEGGFTYLVLEGSAYSRFPPGMTWCGSGVETELLWLKLDASLAVVARDTARVESCLDAIEN